MRRRRGSRLSEKLSAVLLCLKAHSLLSYLPACFKSRKRRSSVDLTLYTLFLVFLTARTRLFAFCTCPFASSLSIPKNKERACFGWIRKGHTRSLHLAALSLCLDLAVFVRTCAASPHPECEGARLTSGQSLAVYPLICNMRVATGLLILSRVSKTSSTEI
jgi:hypothetical protein